MEDHPERGHTVGGVSCSATAESWKLAPILLWVIWPHKMYWHIGSASSLNVHCLQCQLWNWWTTSFRSSGVGVPINLRAWTRDLFWGTDEAEELSIHPDIYHDQQCVLKPTETSSAADIYSSFLRIASHARKSSIWPPLATGISLIDEVGGQGPYMSVKMKSSDL